MRSRRRGRPRDPDLTEAVIARRPSRRAWSSAADGAAVPGIAPAIGARGGDVERLLRTVGAARSHAADPEGPGGRRARTVRSIDAAARAGSGRARASGPGLHAGLRRSRRRRCAGRRRRRASPSARSGRRSAPAGSLRSRCWSGSISAEITRREGDLRFAARRLRRPEVRRSAITATSTRRPAAATPSPRRASVLAGVTQDRQPAARSPRSPPWGARRTPAWRRCRRSPARSPAAGRTTAERRPERRECLQRSRRAAASRHRSSAHAVAQPPGMQHGVRPRIGT